MARDDRSGAGRWRARIRVWTLRLLKVAGAGTALVIAAGFGVYLWSLRGAVIRLDRARRHQTITGWEVTARAWEINKRADRFDASFESYDEEIASRMVNELGINQVRLEIMSGAENPVDYWGRFQRGEIGYLEFKKHFYEKGNDNDDPHVVGASGFHFSALDYRVEHVVLPMKRLLEANGERLRLNLCYVDFRHSEERGTLEHALHPEEYAELIAATFEHLDRKYGLVPDFLEIILEPENTLYWTGTRIGEAMLSATKRLSVLGYTPKIIAPSTSSPHKAAAYFDEMIGVPGVRDHLWMFSYHRYTHLRPPWLALPGIRARATKYGLRTGMLEHVEGSVDGLHEDLEDGNTSAWQLYAVAGTLPPGVLDEPSAGYPGSYYFVNKAEPPGSRVKLGRRARLLVPYFKHVRAGARRLGAETDSLFHSPLFFRNADGRHVLIVKSGVAGRLEVHGLPAGRYGASRTTKGGGTTQLADEVVVSSEVVVHEMPGGGGILALWQRR